MNGEEEVEREVCVDGIHLEYVSEFKYLECVLDESSTDTFSLLILFLFS